MNTINKHYLVFQTEAGWIGIAGSSKGIYRSTFPKPAYLDARLAVDPDKTISECDLEFYSDLIASYKNYFRGIAVEFRTRKDLSEVSEFRKSVYQAALAIPYGETRSYTWIANKIKNPRAARAVGQALNCNPLPILVPCHRVLPLSGGLGGFAGGTDLKRFLLNVETPKKAE